MIKTLINRIKTVATAAFYDSSKTGEFHALATPANVLEIIRALDGEREAPTELRKHELHALMDAIPGPNVHRIRFVASALNYSENTVRTWLCNDARGRMISTRDLGALRAAINKMTEKTS